MKTFFTFLICLLTKIETSAQRIHGPLTNDFSDWLNSNGYSNWTTQFRREDLKAYGSYGGRRYAGQPIKHLPIIFIHGNSDQALNSGGRLGFTGWSHSIGYFLEKGYTSAELYATTWGPADITFADDQVHSCFYLTLLRTFTEAVLEYTGASKINLVSHSMGVTLSRKVVKGGLHTDESGTVCSLGHPLTEAVDTFIGICGGNRGLAVCFPPPANLMKACNTLDGFYPGVCLTGRCEGTVDGMSKYLKQLNKYPHRQEGQHIFTMWSKIDAVIGYEDLVWGYPTSDIVGQGMGMGKLFCFILCMYVEKIHRCIKSV